MNQNFQRLTCDMCGNIVEAELHTLTPTHTDKHNGWMNIRQYPQKSVRLDGQPIYTAEWHICSTKCLAELCYRLEEKDESW